MAIRWHWWTELEVEKMLEYRRQGMTEEKIAGVMTLVFMRRFTRNSVNRKIRDMKNAGLLERNGKTGRYSNFMGVKRNGENYMKLKKAEKQAQKKSRPVGRPKKWRTSWNSNTN